MDPTFSILPLLVFFAELCVVTISTIRIIFLSRGMKTFAAVLGFFEVTIWLFAIGQIMKNLTDIGCYVGFASGFSLGNYLGVMIEKRLAIGMLVVRIVTPRDAGDLLRDLQTANYGVTCMEATGATGPVKVIVTVIPRKELPTVVSLIRGFHSEAFYSVEEIQTAESGIFPAAPSRLRNLLSWRLRSPQRVTPCAMLAAEADAA